jgi:hypothetical protein
MGFFVGKNDVYTKFFSFKEEVKNLIWKFIKMIRLNMKEEGVLK